MQGITDNVTKLDEKANPGGDSWEYLVPLSSDAIDGCTRAEGKGDRRLRPLVS